MVLVVINVSANANVPPKAFLARVTNIAAHLMKQLICWHGTSANHCSSQALFRIKRWHSHGSRLKDIPARWNLHRLSEKRTWPIFILK